VCLQVTGCGDGVTCHVRTFLHGSCRITMSIATLPSHDALPGEERGQVWTWLRPKGATEDINRAVRRCGGTNCRTAVAVMVMPVARPAAL
jgi:hypothetical protein